MTYLSIYFFALLLAVLFIYYILPMNMRWTSLLLGSLIFYFATCKSGITVILASAILTYLFGRAISKNKSKWLLILGIGLTAIPWILLKILVPFLNGKTAVISNPIFLISVMGISFYTLQMISYLADVYKGNCKAQKNILKFILFITFFPQILQGPIPRYDKLFPQLEQGHKFDENNISKGLILIGWGFFLKYMIADKAALIVNPIFEDYTRYRGMYVVVAGILYSLQLYADFSACFNISKGVSRLFGIELEENFRQPFFATSVKDLWRRWHISFSSWLKDYIYIPLGGNRVGKARKYINLIITFLISGIWHGAGLTFLVWGAMQAFYQITGQWLENVWNRLFDFIGLKDFDGIKNAIRRFFSFICFALSFIVFRAKNISSAVRMILSIFTVKNPWILTDDSLLDFDLSLKGWMILLVSIFILYIVSKKKESGVDVVGKIISLPLVVRWTLYYVFIFAVMTFGTYGVGFDAQAFVYGGF